MRLTLGLHVELGADGPMPASIGSAAMGPMGLLQVLETHLGLTAPRPSPTQRTGQLLPRLARTPGWWSHSFHLDPWGSARRMLADLDALTLEGWRGTPVSSRWDALWAVTRDVAPGPGERWAAVADALEGRAHAWLSLCLVDPRPLWPGAIRAAFAALRHAGARIEEQSPPPARAHGDLGRCRDAGAPFEPTGDGSLQLLRGPGPLEAADDLAAWLRAQPEGSVVVVSPDATLDAALRRHGLPGAGVAADAEALGLLGATLQFAAAVPDPARALDLLLTRPSPIPAPLGHTLASALRETPAVGSPAWESSVQRWRCPADAAPPDERTLARIERLLMRGDARPGEGLPVPELRARANVLQRWARRYAAAADAPAMATGLQAVASQCEGLIAMLDGLTEPTASLATVDRMVGIATEDARAWLHTAAQAGLRFCRHPGGLISPTPTVVWWNFTREAASTPRGVGLTRAERAALAGDGVEVRAPAARAEAQARLWWRPLEMASERVVLVSPRTCAPTEPSHPHPLWSELAARMPGPTRRKMAASLERGRPAPLPAIATTAMHRCTPWPRFSVTAGAVPRRKLESPSSLATRVGCPLRWTVHYGGKVSERRRFSMRVRPLEQGKLAHEVLAEVLPKSADPSEAQRLAMETFDALGPRRVAALFQPAAATARGELRANVAASARALAQWMAGHGLTVEAVEDTQVRESGGQPIEGRLDLIASGPGGRVVVDHKLGGRADRARELGDGAAVQLATYAFVAERDGRAPHVGYFIVRDQKLLGIAGGPYPEHDAVPGPPIEAVWRAFLAATRGRTAELDAGDVHAPGVGDGPKHGRLRGEGLELPAPCTYCRYDALCGRMAEVPR